MMSWDQLQPGKKYCEPNQPDTVKLDILPFGLLLMMRREITGNLGWSIERGIAQFRTVMVDSQIVFLSRFGMLPWQMAMFHLAESTSKKIPSPAGGNGLPLYIVLVDKYTGKILNRRVAALSPELAHKLVQLMAQQDPEDRLLNKAIFERRITQKYTTLQLAALANMHTKLNSN